jgi:effector-binding domain-containing protein
VGLVSDFKKWNGWSPWTIAEPDCPVTITGKVGQIGHQMSWDGKIIGSGKNTLIDVSEKQLVYDLEFLKPYKSKAITKFIFSSTKKGIKVTWTMDSSMPFFMFFMIPMMKAWIGMDYDRGLRMLKAVAEKGKVTATTTNKGVVNVAGFSYVGLKRTAAMDEVGPAMQKDFDKIIQDVVVKNGKSAQHWIALYPKFDMVKGTMSYIAAVSDENLNEVDLGSEYVRGSVKDGKALEIFHQGSYEFLGNAWSMGMMFLRAKKMKQRPVPYEYYWNSPKEVKPEKLKTSVFFPLR